MVPFYWDTFTLVLLCTSFVSFHNFLYCRPSSSWSFVFQLRLWSTLGSDMFQEFLGDYRTYIFVGNIFWSYISQFPHVLVLVGIPLGICTLIHLFFLSVFKFLPCSYITPVHAVLHLKKLLAAWQVVVAYVIVR